MATVKIKFRPSSVDGKEGTVYYQVIHVRVARQISTSYRLFPAEWDKRRARIVAAPSDEGRRQHLSLLEGKIMEDTERLEGIITTLERRRGAFTADDVVSAFNGGHYSLSFPVFMREVINGLKRLGKIRTSETLILFGYLKEVVAELKKEFPKAVTVTGSDNVNQKQYAVDSFQNNPDCKLIILNFKSGGTGLTLTAASRVAFIEFPWTFSDCEQAEDRAHRNGQKNNVNCYYFLGKDTIDKYMYDVIQTKKNIANGVTGTDDQVEENMVNLAMDLFRDKL